MLILPIVLSGLALTPIKSEVWWNTPGGQVTEHRDRETVDCTLRLVGDAGDIAFIWTPGLPTRVVVEQADWTLAPGQITTVAIRIGDGWLQGGNGSPNVPALTDARAVMFVLNPPLNELNQTLDDLLASAADIAVNTPDIRFRMTLPHVKLPALLTALAKCRAVTGA